MPDVTATYGWPIPVLSDDPNVPRDVTNLADAVETTVAANAARLTDTATNSVVLTGADVRCGQSATTTVLTTTFTLAAAQTVAVSAKARFEADSTSSAQGDVAMRIKVDGAIAGTLADGIAEAGPGHVGSFANTGRVALSIPTFYVSLAAGSHTIRLEADRDSTGVVNATGDASINSHTYNPTSLTITV